MEDIGNYFYQDHISEKILVFQTNVTGITCFLYMLINDQQLIT